MSPALRRSARLQKQARDEKARKHLEEMKRMVSEEALLRGFADVTVAWEHS